MEKQEVEQLLQGIDTERKKYQSAFGVLLNLISPQQHAVFLYELAQLRLEHTLLLDRLTVKNKEIEELKNKKVKK